MRSLFFFSGLCRQSLWTEKAQSLGVRLLRRSEGGQLNQGGQGGGHGGQDDDGDHEVLLLRSEEKLLNQAGQGGKKRTKLIKKSNKTTRFFCNSTTAKEPLSSGL